MQGYPFIALRTVRDGARFRVDLTIVRWHPAWIAWCWRTVSEAARLLGIARTSPGFWIVLWRTIRRAHARK